MLVGSSVYGLLDRCSYCGLLVFIHSVDLTLQEIDVLILIPRGSKSDKEQQRNHKKISFPPPQKLSAILKQNDRHYKFIIVHKTI